MLHAIQNDGIYILKHIVAELEGRSLDSRTENLKACSAAEKVELTEEYKNIYSQDYTSHHSLSEKDVDLSEVDPAETKEERARYSLIHRRFGHYGPGIIGKLHKVSNIEKIKIPVAGKRICKSCKMGKMRNKISKLLAPDKKCLTWMLSKFPVLIYDQATVLRETDLKTRLAKLERSAKTTDIDIWLNIWIQIENIAKNCNYNWASEIIDRFHASLGHRSVFFATSFVALIWMGSITLPELAELAEQYRLCEAKLKRFEYVGSQDLENVFNPPMSLASIEHEKQKPDKKQDVKKDKSEKCLCGLKFHMLKNCYLCNPKVRPENWVDRRLFASKQRLWSMVTEPGKRSQLEKELGHRLPQEVIEKPTEESSSAVNMSKYMEIYEDYVTESQTTHNQSESFSSYMLALTTSQISLSYKDWWVFDSGCYGA
ncbi:hypothetical protein K3495_g2082 [Podosphaera aphanis]|nr:hypothetical protein K3495_g2082 [Podosphaera aphanis]